VYSLYKPPADVRCIHFIILG
jgi:hypothetical protein